MTAPIEIWHIPGSPNNVKARVALGYKGLDYERHEIDFSAGFPGDRSGVVALSRQPRTPVLKHGDTIVFDSHAILRYLEANFPDTPPLFSDDYAEFGEIERWELFGRTELGPPIGMLFGQALSEAPDAEAIAQANAAFHAATGPLEERLAQGDWLVGSHMTAADVSCAAGTGLACIPAELAETSPVAAFFREHFHLGPGRERTAAWTGRVLAYDRR